MFKLYQQPPIFQVAFFTPISYSHKITIGILKNLELKTLNSITK